MPSELAIRFGTSTTNLVSNPIKPAWILDGQPQARIELLSSSADGTASTYFWDCTAGRFNWFYSFDETLYILEGEVILRDPAGRSHRVTSGDTVFFPAGSTAEWTVDKYVRKLAFCRTPLPASMTLARSIARRLKRAMKGDFSKDRGSGLL
jgi:uncharacterized cupin superfamily protein